MTLGKKNYAWCWAPPQYGGFYYIFWSRGGALLSWVFFEKVVWRVLNDFINYLKRQARGWENWKFLNISPLFLWYMGNVYTTVEILWLDRAKPTWWINLSIFWDHATNWKYQRKFASMYLFRGAAGVLEAFLWLNFEARCGDRASRDVMSNRHKIGKRCISSRVSYISGLF